MKLWSVVFLGAVLIAASGGVAYACGSGGNGGCNGPGNDHGNQCGQPNLVWENPSGDLASAKGVACTLSLTPSTLTGAATNLAPGTNCTFHAILANTGSEAASITQTVTITEPPGCRLFAFTDNIPAGPPPQIAPKGTFSFHGAVSLSPSAGNKCQKATASIYVVITGEGTSSCNQVPGVIPALSDPDWGC